MTPSRIRLGTLLALALAPTLGAADFVPAVYEARQAAAAPTIDGVLDDAAWQAAEVIEPFFAYQSGGAPPAANSSLRLLWDDEFLYVAMHAEDVDIRSSCALARQCGRDASLFNGDVLELFIRPSADRTRYYEFQWSPLGEEFDARFDTRFGAPGTSWESGIESAVSVEGTVDDRASADTGWSVEAKIPFAALGAGLVDAGTEWTFTGSRYDYFNPRTRSGPALMMSTRGDPDAPNGGVTNGFHTYEIYDRLVFVAGVPEPTSQLLLSVAAGAAIAISRCLR